ncbi:MAG: biosynthetic arginine decarboxylase [Phycisphaerales bacterium]|nr:biosynthetic arginine decarboxylase [Phycisphaerales bacterium]
MTGMTTMDTLENLGQWSTADAAELYQINAWGAGYFGISDEGHVIVRPDTTDAAEIDLFEVVEGLRKRNLTAPVLIRFSDILAHRLKHMHEAFATAMSENGYKGQYAAVYPIKVNQQRAVVEEVYRYGEPFDFGLECGSKPELLAVMALTTETPDRLIICNGFKDDAYLEAVILSSKLGRRIIPVIENYDELRMILKHAARYDVRPRIGVRIKLSAEGTGRWAKSNGVKAKFGLTASEVLDVFNVLKERGMEDCLQLVHCHPGSQLNDIGCVKEAVGELAYVYAELKQMGAGLQYIDVGGGLGVDYDGSQTNFYSSMNYRLQEYASEVVYRIGSVCDEREIEHPTIISESGRAIAAYQSVLVFNILGRCGLDELGDEVITRQLGEHAPQPIRDLIDAYISVNERRLLECYHDAVQAREQSQLLFRLGYLPLHLRGLADRLFAATCQKVRALASKLDSLPEELLALESILSETYFANFSVFQSLPDSWAIDQLFPIMPIHRLDEAPACKGVLADITCDSDGRIDRFVDLSDVRHTLDLHALRDGEEYYLAAFLVGAYQETLGDLHNLFGDTHVVHIHLHEKGGWWIDEVIRGDTAAEVLEYVQYDVRGLVNRIDRDGEKAVRDGRLTLRESQILLRFYESELAGYTYLEPEVTGAD